MREVAMRPILASHRVGTSSFVTAVLLSLFFLSIAISAQNSQAPLAPQFQKKNAHIQESLRLDMDGPNISNQGRVGSVKAAVNSYGDRMKTQTDFSVKPSSRARELHRARRDIGRYKESRWTAESAKAQAESELSNAKKKVKDLSSMIEESGSKAKIHLRDMEMLKKSGRRQERALVVGSNENYEHAQVMRELEFVKQELYKLKLDVASVLEEKLNAEKEVKASSSRMQPASKTAEKLKKEIEEANEEQVLVELARIEALKELADVEAQREKEANVYSSKMESTRKKLKDAIEEIDKSKELEMKLAVTMSDVDVLQNELNSVKEMEKRVQRNESMNHSEGTFQNCEESGASAMLKIVTEEIDAAKKELASIKEEGFQFMDSMDVIRNELQHVTAETVRLNKQEAKVESTIKNFNSKLLRAKSKLEAISAAEEKAKSIAISLSHTLDKLKSETEEAKKEKEHSSQEVTTMNADIQKTECEIDIREERLQGAMQELEAIKSSEALALEKLKTLTENTMRDRALAAQHSSVITISKFEYEYLTNHAAAAEEIADKKVAAAQAWVEALKASEKEILIKTKIAQRELKETRFEKELEIYAKEKLLSTRVSEEEFDTWPRKRERNATKNFQRSMSRKSIKSNGNMTPARRTKFQKSASPAARHVSPFTIKKRKKVIPNLAKFFKGKRNTKTS